MGASIAFMIPSGRQARAVGSLGLTTLQTGKPGERAAARARADFEFCALVQ